MSSLEQQVSRLLVMVAEGYADALTEAAAMIRGNEHVTHYTSDQVADMLTGLAAIGITSAHEHFGGAS